MHLNSYCAAKKERYYGFRAHIVINSIGVITSATFCAANVDERDICPELQEKLNRKGLDLQTPLRSNMQENRSKKWMTWLKRKRRLIVAPKMIYDASNHLIEGCKEYNEAKRIENEAQEQSSSGLDHEPDRDS